MLEVGIVEDDEVDDFGSEIGSTYVSRKKDGTPDGFSKTWTETKNGETNTVSFSYYSTDLDAIRKVAEDFEVEL